MMPRRFGLVDGLLLLLVLGVAAGARVWYLSACADNGNSSGPLQVQDHSPRPPYAAGTVLRGREQPTELDALVHHLKAENSFTSLAPLAGKEERTAHVAPGYPLLLTLLENSPVDLDSVDRTVRWLQCGLGALTAACYFLFARRAFWSLGVATLAGLFCALHPFWIVNVAQLEDGVVAGFLLGLCVALGARGGQVGGPLTSWLFGLAAAGLGLVRAAYLPFAFLAVLWFLWRCQTLSRGWLPAFLAFLGFGTGLVPWMVQNHRQFQDVFPIVDSVYLHFWIGNNPAATGGPLSERRLREVLLKDSEVSLEALERSPQPERYRKLAPLVAREMGQDTTATLQRRIRAGLYFFLGQEWFESGRLAQSTPTAENVLPSWLAQTHPALFHSSLLLMLLLGVLGWRWSTVWRHQAMPSSLALMWIPLPYLLSHAEALSGPRLPLDGVLLTYAAFALACMLPMPVNALLIGPSAYTEEERVPR